MLGCRWPKTVRTTRGSGLPKDHSILLYYVTMEQLLEALCYKPEGRDFLSRWADWDFS
jgi:hypothetical protein